jgi:hypothetical protein
MQPKRSDSFIFVSVDIWQLEEKRVQPSEIVFARGLDGIFPSICFIDLSRIQKDVMSRLKKNVPFESQLSLDEVQHYEPHGMASEMRLQT